MLGPDVRIARTRRLGRGAAALTGVLTARLRSDVGRSRAEGARHHQQSRPVHQRLVSAGQRWCPAAPTRRGTARSASVSLAEHRSCRASTATAGGLESPHVGGRCDGLRIGQAMLPSRRASQRCAIGALRARLGASAAVRGLADGAGRLHGGPRRPPSGRSLRFSYIDNFAPPPFLASKTWNKRGTWNPSAIQITGLVV